LTGADALARGAKALEDNDSETAIKMDIEALEIYEEVRVSSALQRHRVYP
jgi:hypothetical protein